MNSGRPPKFKGPRRPVTVTLPVETLAKLESLDSDRARAIVKATDAAVPPNPANQKLIQVVEVEEGLGIIIVGPSKLLQQIEGLRMVEVAPLRFLLTIPFGATIDSVELAVIDLVESKVASEEWEQSLLAELRDLIRNLRQRRELSKAEMLIVDTRKKEGSRSAKRLRAAIATATGPNLARS